MEEKGALETEKFRSAEKVFCDRHVTRTGNGHKRDDIRHFTPRTIVRANMRAGVVDVERFASN